MTKIDMAIFNDFALFQTSRIVLSCCHGYIAWPLQFPLIKLVLTPALILPRKKTLEWQSYLWLHLVHSSYHYTAHTYGDHLVCKRGTGHHRDISHYDKRLERPIELDLPIITFEGYFCERFMPYLVVFTWTFFHLIATSILQNGSQRTVTSVHALVLTFILGCTMVCACLWTGCSARFICHAILACHS